MKKKLFFLSASLLIGSVGVRAQQSVLYQDNFRSIVFQSNEMKINTFEGGHSIYPLDDVRSLVFKSGATNPILQTGSDEMRVIITANEVRIESAEAVKSLSVFNINGSVTGTANTASITIATLPAGIYILLIETEKGITTKKFIKQ